VLARQVHSRSEARDARERQFGRRLALSFAAAVGLHEVFAGFIPAPDVPQAPESVVAIRTITVTKRAKPLPTPKPAPLTSPPPRAAIAPLTSVKAPAAKAAATPHAAIGGAAAPRRVAVTTPAPIRPHAPPLSSATGSQTGRQNGGTGSGAGSGNGTSGLAGTGPGAASSGSGNAGAADTVCGQVYLIPGRVDYRADGTVLQYVIAKVITANDVLVGRFPYPFTYSADQLNPFKNLAVSGTEDPGIPVQMPPAELDQSALLPAVAFVLKYTNPDGHTTLPTCPTPSP